MSSCALAPHGAFPGTSSRLGQFQVRDAPRARSEYDFKYVAALDLPLATPSRRLHRDQTASLARTSCNCGLQCGRLMYDCDTERDGRPIALKSL